MLYAHWRQVATRFPSRPALVECASGRSWTFRELAAEIEASPPGEGWEHPSGHGAEFIVSVARAWRDGRPVCPLEPGQVVTRPPVLPPEVTHLKLTSATTGAPRLVAFTQDQLAADADQIVAMMGLQPGQPNLGVISLAHSYGFSNLVLPLLLHGIPLIVVGSHLPESLRRAAAGHDRLTLPAVPALWRSWHEAGAIPPAVRLAISAGAPLPLPLELAIHAASGLKVHNFYGATECGGIAYDPSDTPRSSADWVGLPMPGLRLSVAGDGCLEVHGASVGLGYIPPDPHHLGDRRHRTRDLVEIAADGGICLRGRASDLINIAGRKVAPESIEAVIADHPAVRGCVVFGVPDDDVLRQDRVVAIVGREIRAGVEREIQAHALTRLPPWQMPKEWRWLPEIPTSVRGKISRPDWRRRFLAGDLQTSFSIPPSVSSH